MKRIQSALFLVLIFLLKSSFSFETASFYGGSYVSIPLQEAKSTTELSLRFRTKQSDALLFIAAGKTDYCLIKLQSGKLKVHINLGAGESELSSPKGLRLDDLIWHQVTLNRKDGEVNVTIDKIHNIREKLPGRFFELNIYDGLFLGGVGDTLDLFLGHFEWLRGCLSAVTYNGVDALRRARYRTALADAHGVSWSCASEFEAPFSHEIGFVEEGAFLAIPNPISRTGVRWQFEIKTVSENAILFYNSKLVHGGRNDYVGLEINNSKLRLIMDTGSGTTEVFNEALVSDGEWHLVTVQINPTMLEIVVDGRFIGSSHASSRALNKYLDLSDVVYVGGLELNKQANALSVGLKSADKSLKGCLRNMEADGKLMGFPNARVTQGVLPNCAWSFPCVKRPCGPNASCLQFGIDSFRCICDKSTCANPDVKKYKTKTWLPFALEMLSTNALQVLEGERGAVLAEENINVIVDYAKYGIRDTGVKFTVVQAPTYGTVTVADGKETQFMLADLANEKVYYVHDGSENYNDSVVIEFQFGSAGIPLPEYLQGKYSFVFPVTVAPVNDPPFLSIIPGKVLRLAEGTRKVITSEYLNATDTDNSNSELLYSIVSLPGVNNMGHIEKLDTPGTPIAVFTQEDIDDKKIVYVHSGSNTGDDKIAFQVSDGILTSAVSFFRVSIFPLELSLVNNTGIMLAHNSSALIMYNNLFFQTNAEDPFMTVNYEIVELPKYGIVQCLIKTNTGEESWQPVKIFTNHHILREELRYVQTDVSEHDSFKFKVSTKNIVLPNIYEFQITFVQLKLTVITLKPVEITENKVAVVKDTNLKVITEPLPGNNSVILFTLKKVPRICELTLGDTVLLDNGTWSQRDIMENKLAFRLPRKTFSVVEDNIVFTVSAPQCEPLPEVKLSYKYRPSPEQIKAVQVSVRSVQVSEGGQQPLLLEHLNIVYENVSLLTYQIVEGPAHGWLDMHDVDHTTIDVRYATQFLNTDILKQRVTYTHDDSESMNDTIRFIVYGSKGEDFQVIVKLGIEVFLKNDNPPYCVVNKGLQVVTGADKLLTDRELLYGDPDIDSKPETIIYTRRGITNGAFLLANPPYNQLFEFTQNDINKKRVLFRHNGALTANISMWVSDGDHYSEFVFGIVASAPFVKLNSNNKLLLRQGGFSVITSNNLLATTNMNVMLHQIKYKILEGPFSGQIERHNSIGAMTFTQDDIENGQLIYRYNEITNSVSDKFTFKVSVQDVHAEDVFRIRLFQASYFEPMQLINNKTVFVDEASDALITKDALMVQQSNVPASDIMYYVVEQPKYGYLEQEVNGQYSEVDYNYLFHPNVSDDSKDTAIMLFNQSIVDAEKLHYIHVILNQTNDRIVLDVTNGILWLRNIVMNIIIIPEQIYLNINGLNVEEGGYVELKSSSIQIQSSYYAERISEYRLKKYPKHGFIKYIGSTSVANNVSKWSTFQLNNHQIQYVHDGSESSSDSLSLVAIAGDKESVPAKLHVTVIPVNDESPVVVNNTGVLVWRGGYCNISSSNLAFVDNDTRPSDLIYVVISAQSGYVALSSNLNFSIDKFSQLDVNEGRISFVHSGDELDGEFDVVVGDGVRTSEPITVRAHVRLPSLHLSRAVPFRVFPMLRKAIVAAHLTTWCPYQEKRIYYVVRVPPMYGQIVYDGSNVSLSVTNFTQADVNASRIWYQHAAADAAPRNDSFMFDVVAEHAEPLLNVVFDIEVAVSSGGLDGLLDIETYEVDEGGLVRLIVNTTNIVNFLAQERVGLRTASLRGQVVKEPSHGRLCVRSVCGVTELTNSEMNEGAIEYRHDDSDSKYDEVVFAIVLERENVTLCNVTAHVTVLPVNDQPFTLVRHSPNVTVTQGDAVSLTEEHLLTVDDDTSMDDLTYEIVNEPSVGAMTVGGARVNRFTQRDVNTGRVAYEHAGAVQSTSVYVRVSDGQFAPNYTVINVRVVPATLSVIVSRPVFLTQGFNSTVVPSVVFAAHSNRRLNDIAYSVTTTPRYGYVMVNGVRANGFKHADLKAKKVSYVQTDMSVAGDAFEVEATLPRTELRVSHLRVNVSVESLVKVGAFTPASGTRTCITTDVLNAHALTKLTDEYPKFEIVKRPRHGRVQRIVKRSRVARALKQGDAEEFTYDEVVSRVIYYVAKRVNATVEDGFAFLVRANAVQPALGELRFSLSPDAPVTPKKLKPKTKVGPVIASEISDAELAPNMTDDHMLMVVLLLIVMAVSLAFVSTLRCQSKKRQSRNPPALPRPPDDLMPSSPYPKRTQQNCKVIPLGSESLTSSEHDFNLGYPYGVADEDWSSYDTSGYSSRTTTNNPMLRKNQYWV